MDITMSPNIVGLCLQGASALQGMTSWAFVFINRLVDGRPFANYQSLSLRFSVLLRSAEPSPREGDNNIYFC